MNNREVMQLALDALKFCDSMSADMAITALRAALKNNWQDSPCRIWPSYINPQGYGEIGTSKRLGKNLKGHRIVWEAVNGPVPEGMELDHLCRNRACVNPAHLEAVTHKENTLRGAGPTAINSRKTQCVNGHDFSPENTRILGNGRRQCKTCQERHTANNQAKRKRLKQMNEGGEQCLAA
jgi:hypothetical protein